MSRDQIIKLVGKDALVQSPEETKDSLSLTTAPKPNPAFEKYLLVVSPTAGLLKIVACGKTVETGDAGAELQSAFEDVVTGMSKKYGKPSGRIDDCSGTGCDSPEFWMMSLLEKNRQLVVYWKFDTPVNAITGIIVDANPLRINSGWIGAQYEFEGFSQWSDSRKAKQDDSY